MANYPSTPVVFPARSDGQTIFAQHIQLLQDEIAAIEAGLLSTGLQHTLWGAQALTLSGVLTPPTLNAQQNDYAPAGLSTAYMIRQQLSANVTITGILAQGTGRVITIANFGGFVLTLAHLNASSAATNQIACPGSQNFAIPNGGTVTLFYDAVNSFWRLIGMGVPPPTSSITYIGAKVYRRTTQSLTANTWAAVTFDTAELNLGPCWAAGAPTRLTVPAGQGGHYLIYGKFQGNAAAILAIRMAKNGAVASTAVTPATSSGTAGAQGVADTTIMALNAGDYVELAAMAVVSITIGGATADLQSEFGMYKLNPT